jgi:osmotically inducible protein OsmC
MPTRTSHARWQGDLKQGAGSMALGSKAYEGSYSFVSRFEEGQGTNPEELIAAAHAGCFSMAFANVLSQAGHTPNSIDTDATVHLERTEGGFGITRIDLVTRGDVPGIDEAEFTKHAETAKATCPVSRALAAVPEITLQTTLV